MNHETRLNPQRPAWRIVLAVTALALGACLSQMAWALPFGGHGGLGSPAMGGSPRHMERLLDEAKATPDQRAQIKQITEAARAEMAAQREAGRKLHEQNRDLFAQPTLDARTAEVLRRLGVNVIDAEPEHLPVALTDHYLLLKSRGLL